MYDNCVCFFHLEKYLQIERISMNQLTYDSWSNLCVPTLILCQRRFYDAIDDLLNDRHHSGVHVCWSSHIDDALHTIFHIFSDYFEF